MAILNETPVDCAVLDIKLRDGPCVALAEALAGRGIHVTLTTGYSVSGVPEQLRHLPIFTKPTDLAALVEHLADCCRTDAVRKPEVGSGQPTA